MILKYIIFILLLMDMVFADMQSKIQIVASESCKVEHLTKEEVKNIFLKKR